MNDTFIKPFNGLLYNASAIGDISRCVCPPYDVISNVEPYYARDLHNAIRLELPVSTPLLDQYSNARKILDDWIREETLRFDPAQSFYLYEQDFIVNGKQYFRRGFFTLVKPDRDRILTHEQTRKKAKEDRERLFTATRTFTSIIFGLYEDRGGKVEATLEKAAKEVVYDFIDEDGIRNRFYRIAGDNDTTELARVMENETVYIADGHHRLDVSRKLGIPYVPFYLTAMHSPGIVILPYHRLVTLKSKQPLSALLNNLGTTVSVEKKDRQAFTLDGWIDYIAASKDPAYLLYSHEDRQTFFVLRQTAPIPVPPETDPVLADLRVTILHTGLLKTVLGIEDEEISFTHDAAEAVSLVDGQGADMAFLLPPTTVDEVKVIADHSLDMPPKSTFFYPKILTGLVFYKYA